MTTEKFDETKDFKSVKERFEAQRQEWEVQQRAMNALIKSKAADDKLIAEYGYTDEVDKNGNKISWEQKFQQQIRFLTEITGQKSYETFETAVGNLAAAIEVMLRYFNAVPFGSLFDDSTRHLFHYGVQKVRHMLFNLVGKSTQDYELEYMLNTDEEGVLQFDIYRDNKPLKDQERDVFMLGVVAWLKVQGYDCNPDTKKIVHTGTQNPITPEELEQLSSQRQNNSLENFFSEEFKLKIEPMPDNRAPSIAPRF